MVKKQKKTNIMSMYLFTKPSLDYFNIDIFHIKNEL